MIDLRYHITSIVAVFLALAIGILIGSTIVGDNLMVDQQKKLIDRLEEQFTALHESEDELKARNQYQEKIISQYENYSQSMLPILIKQRLEGYKAGIVVTGGSDIPAGMLNSLSIAGVNVVSKTVVLSEVNLNNQEVRTRLIQFYNLDAKTSVDSIRMQVADSVASILMGQADAAVLALLQELGLIKMDGLTDETLDGVIIVGGTNDDNLAYPYSFDQGLILTLLNGGKKVYGVENSEILTSYMEEYQKHNISTIDNIDLSPGQISLILAMAGEPGHYGIKPTAKRFIPTLPVEKIGGQP
ncbi:MAG: copper transporter [Syntrophomonadaceae bacterium]|jgi:hypothetical protein